jgi:hypothetical protein
MGTDIQLTTTRNDYLQINAVQPFGWANPQSGGGSTTTTKVGGNKGGYNVPANTKAKFNEGTARQSTNYGTGVNGGSYPAINAFRGKFTHTKVGKGEWWEV